MDFEKWKKDIGKRIKLLRLEKKETQLDLARAINVTQDNISKIEKGRVALTLENQLRIAEYYHVTHDYICIGSKSNSLLDLLKKYMFIKYQRVSIGDETFEFPKLEIHKVFYDFLIGSAHAEKNKHMPNEIKKQWSEIEAENFYQKIKKDSFVDYVSIIPITEQMIWPDDNKIEWKQSDLLRAIDKLVDN